MPYVSRPNVTEDYGRIRVAYVQRGGYFHLDAGYGRIVACVGQDGQSVQLNYARYEEMNGGWINNGNIPPAGRGPGRTFNAKNGVDFSPASGDGYVGIYYIKD